MPGGGGVRSKLVGLGGWLKNSFIDFPGTVSTVLFFSGCNLRCPYCHNKSLVENPAVDHSELSNEFWEFLEARKNVLGGVVLSGGEPTLVSSLPEIVGDIHAVGLRVKLDTNGLLPGVLEQVPVDYIALDIKAVPNDYPSLLKASCGAVAEKLQRSLAVVRRMGAGAEVRITVAPRIISLPVIEQLRPLLEGVREVVLQPMDTRAPLLDQTYNALELVPDEEIERMREILAHTVEICRIRGQ
jgi:pyruvate formate lyase activating enzyme